MYESYINIHYIYFESRSSCVNIGWWQYPGDSSQHTFLRCLLNIWVMQVNILRKIINRTMTGWFKSTYFLEMFFNHMSDTSQHTLENQQQDNGWVIQVNMLSWKVFQAYHMGDVNSTYFRNSIKVQWVGDSSNHTFLRYLSTISEQNRQTHAISKRE